jgi:hypothetical protein
MLSKFCSFFLFWCESGIKGFLGLINFTLVIAFILRRKVGYLDETERNKINIVDFCECKIWVLCGTVL